MTLMRKETAEIPEATARLATPDAQAVLIEAGRTVARADPSLILTVARGSSDHAATFLSYATQIATGVPVASFAPSVASVYKARMKAPNAVAMAISQSGASTDLATATRFLANGGALSVVLTNTADSPLAALGQPTLDILAGPECAVAATKSFVNSILAGMWLLAHWTEDTALADGLRAIPDSFAQALAAPTDALVEVLVRAPELTFTARGTDLGLAAEAALKVQEILGRGAVAHSGAEILHGPVSRMAEGHRVIAFGDPGAKGLEAATQRLSVQGAALFHMPPVAGADMLPPFLRTLPRIAAFYRAIEIAAGDIGTDPDNPQFLLKETVTL